MKNALFRNINFRNVSRNNFLFDRQSNSLLSFFSLPSCTFYPSRFFTFCFFSSWEKPASSLIFKNSSLKTQNLFCIYNGKRCFSTKIKTRDSVDITPALDRQAGVLIERMPRQECTEEKITDVFKRQGIDTDADSILIMRSRLGVPTGRILVLTDEKIGDEILQFLPYECTYRVVDDYDAAIFVEQCERFVRLSDDLRRLGDAEKLERILTFSEIPRSYGRSQLQSIIKEHTNIVIDPRDIIFRFSKNGIQSDMAWIVCSTKKDANTILSIMQEVAVPKRFQYGALFGSSFIWASRSSLFLCDPALDFIPSHSKYQVYTGGWLGDVSLTEFQSLLSHLKFYPSFIKKYYVAANNSSSFFLTFDRFKNAKIAMQRFHLLQRRWKIPRHEIFYAYLKSADVHWEFEEKYADEDSAADTDLDEPIDY